MVQGEIDVGGGGGRSGWCNLSSDLMQSLHKQPNTLGYGFSNALNLAQKKFKVPCRAYGEGIRVIERYKALFLPLVLPFSYIYIESTLFAKMEIPRQVYKADDSINSRLAAWISYHSLFWKFAAKAAKAARNFFLHCQLRN